jgi:hypothetical protein
MLLSYVKIPATHYALHFQQGRSGTKGSGLVLLLLRAERDHCFSADGEHRCSVCVSGEHGGLSSR